MIGEIQYALIVIDLGGEMRSLVGPVCLDSFRPLSVVFLPPGYREEPLLEGGSCDLL